MSLGLAALFLAATQPTRLESQQAAASSDTRKAFASRAELRAEAAKAEEQNRAGEAWLLRSRLQRGDFKEGDRIVVTLQGVAGFNDTLIVRTGTTVQFPRMDDLSLEGVLRSELPARIADHLGRYLRDSSARVTPLVRLAVLGEVRMPGFYYVPADAILSDVLMRAGGPSPLADFGKIDVRRGANVVWSASDVRTALADGMSVDRLHLSAGDEIHVGQKKQRNWMSSVQVAVSLVSVGLSALFLMSR